MASLVYKIFVLITAFFLIIQETTVVVFIGENLIGQLTTSVQEKKSDDSKGPGTASSKFGLVDLIVGVAVTGLICWLCCIRRRQPGDQQDTRTDQRRHHNSISTNQPSTIIQNETFLSDQQTNTYDTLDHTDVQNDTYTNAYSS